MENEHTLEASSNHNLSKAPQQPANEFDELIRKGLNFRPYVRSIVRNLWLVAGFATALSTFAVLRSASQPPVYGGGFQLLVEPLTTEARVANPLAVTRADGGVPNREAFGLDYPSQIAVLQSPGVLASIVEAVRKEYPSFSEGQLRSGLTVGRVGDALIESPKIIEVRYTGSDPHLVELVLEETAKRYLRYSLEDRKTRFSEGIKFIDSQLPELRERVNTLQNALQSLQQQYDVISPDAQAAQISDQLNEIAQQENQARKELREQATLYTTLRSQLSLSPEEGIAASALSQDPGYRNLQQQMQSLEQQIAIDSARLSEESPVMRAHRAKQRNLQNLMAQNAQRILGQNLSGATSNPQVMAFQNDVRLGLIQKMVDASNQIRVLQARNEEVARARREIQARFQQFPEIARRYTDLTRQLQIATRNLDQLSSQRETLRIESAQTEVPWELVVPPSLPKDAAGNPIPFPPDRRRLIAMMLASVILGAGLALLLDKLRDIFFTVEDVQDAIDLPVLGVVPYDRDAGYLQDNLPPREDELPDDDLLEDDLPDDEGVPVSLFQEAFSTLYASLCFLSEGVPVRSLAVCSAAPGDGKTTIALHLADTVASMGRNVLLVDGNLRHPDLHNRFDLISQKGLSEVLLDGLDPESVIQPTAIKNLSILAAGQASIGAVRLLASKRMQEVMAKLHQSFDLVIYDTPHLLGLTDAEFLAANTDGILMVVGVRQTKRSVALQVMQHITTYRLQSLGVVANHPRRQAIASFGYYKPFQRPPRRQVVSAKPAFRFRLKPH